VTWDDVVRLGLALPGVEVSTSYGTPALKVGGKLMARLWEDGQTLVLVRIGFDQRELLMEVEPEVFFLTPHYQDYPSVLARLPKAQPAALAGLLDQIWREVAPKRLVKAREASGDAGSERARGGVSGH
jgi:hypothetical protein